MSVKVNNLLLRLLNGSEGNRLIVITDGSSKKIGLTLFKNFLSNSTGQESRLLLLDNNMNSLDMKNVSNRIQIFESLGNNNNLLNELDLIASIPPGRELFIDSLAPLLIMYPDVASSVISSLKKKFQRIVALVTSEILTHHDNLIIKDLADTIIEVDSNSSTYQATISHKKTATKLGVNLTRVRETFNISNGQVSYAKNIHTPKESEPKSSEQTIEDLPFNLRSDEDNLIRKTTSLELKQPGGGGKVYYEPGKEDDIDEEDPDEDLLI